MTDTGQIPGEGLPENAGKGGAPGPVQGLEAPQPGAQPPGANHSYLDPSAVPTEDDDQLLMPSAQGAWGEPQIAEPGPHETAGRDSGQLDLNGARTAGAHPGPARRPQHLAPPVPDATASPVRSLADRGPAGAPRAHAMNRPAAGPPTAGPEYLDVPRAATGPLPGPQLGELPPQDPAAWQQQPEEGGFQEAVAPAAAQQPVPVEPQGEAGVMDAGYTEGDETAAAAQAAQEAQAAHDAFVAQAVQAEQAAQSGQAAPPGTTPQTNHPTYPAPGTYAPGAQVAPGEPGYAEGSGQFPLAAETLQPPVTPGPVDPQPVESPQPGAAQPPSDGGQAYPATAADGGTAASHSGHAGQEAPESAGQPAVAQPPAGQPPAPAADASQGGHRTPAPVTARPGASDRQPMGAPQFARVGGGSGAILVPDTAYLTVPEAARPAAGQAQSVDMQNVAPQGAEPGPAGSRSLAGQGPVGPVPDAPEQYRAVSGDDGASLGRFVPVEGSVPTTPHLAPTPAQATPVPGLPAETPATEAPETEVQQAEASAGGPGAAVAAEAQAPASVEDPTGQADPAEQSPPSTQPSPAAPAAGPDASAETTSADAAVADTGHVADGPAAGNDPAAGAGTDPGTPEAGPEPAPMPMASGTPAAAVPAPRDGEHPQGEAPGQDQGRTDEAAEPDAAQDGDSMATHEAADEDAQDAQDADEAVSGTGHTAPGPVAEPFTPGAGGTAAPGYDEAEREAVLRVMRERRDIRNGFRSDPIPHEVLLRVLEAAHTAPSVGHSQPWDFVVIRSADTRRAMHELAMRQRDAYAKSLPKGRAKQFKELKIEAILDTPVNIVVTADPTRGGRHTLGRHTQPQMAPYSSALAVENLWLAARAEGLGVGWVSFFDEREMVRELDLPEHLDVVAYLCVGYVDEFPDEPELMQAGWSKRRPLSWVVHEETYGRRALPGEEPHDLLAETIAGIRPLDAKALGEAWERQKRMTKPPGALGMLEIISAQLSGLSRMCPPPIPEPAAVAIFAGDHGVHAQGVTPWPQEVTGQMVANFLGGGAVCNAFANQVGAEVCVIDVGVASELPATPGLLPRKIRAGTADMTTGPALTREEVKAAIEVGIETARDLVAAGNKALITGEMGIANTTASAALIAVFTDCDPAEVTGRGTGINDETLARKTEVVRRALELHRPDPADPIGVLAAIGGLEHAALVGLLLGGASLRTPVVLDGVSAGAAALVARAVAPEVLAACIAGHRSAEPGHVAALNKLGLRPLVDLDLRLGEGTGALLALPVVQSAARAMHEVATFDSAGVTEK